MKWYERIDPEKAERFAVRTEPYVKPAMNIGYGLMGLFVLFEAGMFAWLLISPPNPNWMQTALEHQKWFTICVGIMIAIIVGSLVSLVYGLLTKRRGFCLSGALIFLLGISQINKDAFSGSRLVNDQWNSIAKTSFLLMIVAIVIWHAFTLPRRLAALQVEVVE